MREKCGCWCVAVEDSRKGKGRDVWQAERERAVIGSWEPATPFWARQERPPALRFRTKLHSRHPADFLARRTRLFSRTSPNLFRVENLRRADRGAWSPSIHLPSPDCRHLALLVRLCSRPRPKTSSLPIRTTPSIGAMLRPCNSIPSPAIHSTNLSQTTRICCTARITLLGGLR